MQEGGNKGDDMSVMDLLMATSLRKQARARAPRARERWEGAREVGGGRACATPSLAPSRPAPFLSPLASSPHFCRFFSTSHPYPLNPPPPPPHDPLSLVYGTIGQSVL
eukprot:4229508-Pleurochrysis_carterae.AAC.1